MMDEAILQAHLSRWSSTDFQWDVADCMRSVFDYVGEVRKCDVGGEWRGAYHDEKSALRVLEAAGGGCAGMDKSLKEIGLKRVKLAHRGDPVCASINNQQIGGIYLGLMTAFRMPGRGRIDMRVKHIGVWRL